MGKPEQKKHHGQPTEHRPHKDDQAHPTHASKYARKKAEQAKLGADAFKPTAPASSPSPIVTTPQRQTRVPAPVVAAHGDQWVMGDHRLYGSWQTRFRQCLSFVFHDSEVLAALSKTDADKIFPELLERKFIAQATLLNQPVRHTLSGHWIYDFAFDRFHTQPKLYPNVQAMIHDLAADCVAHFGPGATRALPSPSRNSASWSR